MAIEQAAAHSEVGSEQTVRRSVHVKATPERAFDVFTRQMDSWWPPSHHIGNSPMKAIVVEERPGGAIYTQQEDGTSCPWGTVLAWEPPRRFLLAWQVSPDWHFEGDLDKCSEVEVRFTPADEGTTLVELEHRNFHRHGGAYDSMRSMVGSPEGGWGGLLRLFAARAEEVA